MAAGDVRRDDAGCCHRVDDGLLDDVRRVLVRQAGAHEQVLDLSGRLEDHVDAAELRVLAVGVLSRVASMRVGPDPYALPT
jgi:hypothetical protein